ncbi:MAG: histidine kinase [Verrucomicrobiales bacterium]|nr:histidine kinase [Verrucomicrobiales bacterium]|tara:strand:- start:3872 stop:5608 length:1737 start_codon:yes stop_codon:yes gene_type:complete
MPELETNSNSLDRERIVTLYQVSKVIHSTLDPQEALQLIVREAASAIGASSGSVVLLNPTTGLLEIHASHGLPEDALDVHLRPNEGITGWVVRNSKPALVNDVRKDERYVAVREGVSSELAVPLMVDGELRGVLNLDSDRPDAFSEADHAFLEELADQAASSIHHTWVYEQVRVKARMFEGLASIGQAVNSTLNLADTLNVVTSEAGRLMNAKVASLFLLDPTGEELVLKASFGAGEEYVNRPAMRVDESLIGTVVRRRKPVQEFDVRKSGRYVQHVLAHREELASLLSVPLVFAGEATGVLNIYSSEPHVFSDEEVGIVSTLAELSAVAIEKARLYERIVDVEEQLRQSEQLSAIGLLAAEVAHEIRNPLTVMKMLFHSLDLNFPADDPRNEDAKIMGQKMDHLNRVVDQILDFSRRSAPKFTPIQINQLIDDLTLLTRHKLKAQGIELLRNPQPDLPEILADATQIEQAFLNLTLNAADAMPEGGSLTVTTRSKEESVEIEFRDTGSGMTEEQQKAAFSSWFTAEKESGTGLGLAIVSRVVEAHGGKISIQSDGKGTAFLMELPLDPPKPEEQPAS